jgi:hypothetical protein
MVVAGLIAVSMDPPGMLLGQAGSLYHFGLP